MTVNFFSCNKKSKKSFASNVFVILIDLRLLRSALSDHVYNESGFENGSMTLRRRVVDSKQCASWLSQRALTQRRLIQTRPSDLWLQHWTVSKQRKEILYFYETSYRPLGKIRTATSVTRFGDLLDFGQLFKAFGNN